MKSINLISSRCKFFNHLYNFQLAKRLFGEKHWLSTSLAKQVKPNYNKLNSTDLDYENYISITSSILKISEKDSKFLFSILQLKRKYFHSKMINNRFFCEYLLILDLLNKHFTSSQIINCPEMFLLTYSGLQFKITSLLNFGFKNLKPIHIIYYSTFITYNELQLKELYILDKDVNVLESLLLKYSLKPEDKLKIEKSIGDEKTSLPIGSLKNKILNIIQSQINLPSKKCDETTLNELNKIQFLTQRAKEYLKEIKCFKELNVHFLVTCYPTLMKLATPQLLLENLTFLVHQLKMTEDQLLAGLRAVALPKSNLVDKLDVLIGIFGNKILTHPSILGFISQANFTETVEKLKNIDLFKVDKAFPHLIRKKEKTVMISAFIFYKLSLHIEPSTSVMELNKMKKRITERLNEHPFCSTINFKNATQVLEYLLIDQSLLPNQVANASCIVMYDIPSIKLALNEIKNNSNYQDWAQDQNLLQLALYYLEKRNFFKGEVVFANV